MPKVTEKLRSESLSKALELAKEESALSGFLFVASDHLLLGLIRNGDQTSQLLINAGATLERARAESRKIKGEGTSTKDRPNEIPYTPRAAEVLLVADKESTLRNLITTDTQELLSALIFEKGVAFKILLNLEVNINALSQAVSARQMPLGSFSTASEFVKAHAMANILCNDLFALPGSMIGLTSKECTEFLGVPAEFSENELTFQINYREGKSSCVRLVLKMDRGEVVAYRLERHLDQTKT